MPIKDVLKKFTNFELQCLHDSIKSFIESYSDEECIELKKLLNMLVAEINSRSLDNE